jgi:elongation factor P
MQYLYKEGENYIFMENQTFEQYAVSGTIIGDFHFYMKPNDTLQLLVNGDQVVGVRFPKKVRLLVTESADGARGDTVAGAGKVVTVETGLQVTVPLFIKEGELIAIDPETGAYIERA